MACTQAVVVCQLIRCHGYRTHQGLGCQMQWTQAPASAPPRRLRRFCAKNVSHSLVLGLATNHLKDEQNHDGTCTGTPISSVMTARPGRAGRGGGGEVQSRERQQPSLGDSSALNLTCACNPGYNAVSPHQEPTCAVHTWLPHRMPSA